MLKNIQEKIEIETIELAIEHQALHETKEYIAQRIKQALEEVLEKLEKRKELEQYLHGGDTSSSNYPPQSLFKKGNEALQIGLGQTEPKPGVGFSVNNPFSFISKKEVFTPLQSNLFPQTKETNPKDFGHNSFNFDTSNAKKWRPKPSFSFFTEGDEQNIRIKLIEKLEEKLRNEINNIPFLPPTGKEKPTYSTISSPNRRSEDPKIRRLEDLISLVKNPSNKLREILKNNKDLLEIYKEIASGREVQNLTPNRNVIRKKLIKKIKKTFIDVEPKKDKKIIDYWNFILQQLQKPELHLQDLFFEHKELFLVLNSITDLPEFVSLTEMLKLELNILHKFTDVYNYGISRDEIFVRLGTYRDKVGQDVYKITSNSKQVKYVPESIITFKVSEHKTKSSKIKEKRLHRNWIVRKLVEDVWVNYENYVDVGSQFTKQFNDKGIYLVEAYGSNFTKQKSLLWNYQTKKRIKKLKENKWSKPYFVIYVKEPELTKIGTSLKKDHIREGEGYTFRAISDIKNYEFKNLVWTITHIGETEMTQKKERNVSFIDVLFEEKGEYIISVETLEGVKKEKKVTVGGNWVKEISSLNKDYMLYRTNDQISFKVDKYELKYDEKKDKESILWEILDTSYGIGEIPIAVFKGENKITYSNKQLTEGTYKVVASSKTIKGVIKKAHATFEVIHPEVTNAYWAYANGIEKKYIGFNEEESYINATIEYYENKEITIDLYNGIKRLNIKPIKTKTDSKGKVNYKINVHQFLDGIIEGEKISFNIRGRGYKLKNENKFTSYSELTVVVNEQITFTSFALSGKRVSQKEAIYYGSTTQIVIGSVNLIGEKINISVHRANTKTLPIESVEEIFNIKDIVIPNDGKVVVDFLLEDSLKENHNNGEFFYIKSEIPTKNIISSKEEILSSLRVASVQEFDPQLAWGNKVNPEFRRKVIEICKELWGDHRKMKMANELMICMAVETKNKFTPDIGYPKATGLIQFTQIAIDDMNGIQRLKDGRIRKLKRKYNGGKELTKKILKNMTAIEQLDYVKLYFKMHIEKYKRKINNSTDMYMAIFAPNGVGKSDDFVIYSEKKSKINKDKNYRSNKSADGEYYDERTGKRARGKKDGELTRGEMKARIKEARFLGDYAKNNVLMINAYNSILNNTKNIFNLDIKLVGYYFNVEQIAEIRKRITKLTDDKSKIKAYRILSYFIKYNSQRDAKSKGADNKKLADSMCNVVSESMAFDFLGKMIPVPDPEMKIEDFLMRVITDSLKQNKSNRVYVGTRISIAKELGVKGEYKMVDVVFDKDKHKSMLKEKLNKGYAVSLSTLSHIVRLVDVNDEGLIIDDPYGKITSFKIRKEKGRKKDKRGSGGYKENGIDGRNSKDNIYMKGESNLWSWEQLKKDKILFYYYEWYYL